jgi:glycosyltransferase involved in cell wall biosynthesis
LRVPPAAANMSQTLVSIIAPVYNEEALIEEFYRRVAAVADGGAKRYRFEFILVDDGSRDGSLAIMRRLAEEDPRLRVIQLRRNYGQTPAIQAGLDAARGDILITLDADLQHYPEEITAFLAKLEEGFDIVCGWRHERAEGVLRRWPSALANRIVRWISGVDIHDFGTTFRAYRREIVKDLRLFGEFHRFIPALGATLGGNIAELPIRNIERPAGKSNYGIGRTTGVFLDLFVLFFIVRYMDRPMRAFGKLALATFGVGALILATMVVLAYVYNVHMVQEHLGWFMLSVLLMLAGIQILLTGLLAEILIRIHFGQGDRRVYQIRKEWNADTVSS